MDRRLEKLFGVTFEGVVVLPGQGEV